MVILLVSAGLIGFVWNILYKPLFAEVSPPILTKINFKLAQECIVISNKMDTCFDNLTALEKAEIKSTKISELNHVGTYEDLKYGLTVEIQSLKSIKIENSYGIEILARAWRGNKQLGFGKDGDIEIERFRIFNPPILVDDLNGDIIRKWIDDKTKELKQRKLREDPIKAVQETLISIIRVVGKENTNIVKGKIGSTVSTFYPDPSIEVTSVDGRIS